ncbi:hypothetical protein D6792_01015 [Candidatus Parcubacteria bacterium]|nr:MAG: hypothetical protein D6792_01015 [Candidatus Parcubacteria bacterium]GIW68992.1 MAG: segregation and condensation protein A [Candidatus Parcubacteria bacterium]
MALLWGIERTELPKIAIEQRFSGPLDELLDLIQSRRLPISSVSLARITQEYLERAQNRAVRSLDEMVLVLWIAATLLHIKATSLLPHAKAASEEEESDASELTRRLAILQEVREYGKQLGAMWGNGAHVRLRTLKTLPTREKTANELLASVSPLTLGDLAARLARRLAATREQEIPGPQPTVQVCARLSLREAIHKLAQATQRGSTWRFCVHHYQKADAVVFFLAILELLRTGVVEVEQVVDQTTLVIRGMG